MEVTTSTHGDAVDVAWLMRALEHARSQGQERTVDCLEAVADDVIFEMESTARHPPVAHQ